MITTITIMKNITMIQKILNNSNTSNNDNNKIFSNDNSDRSYD